MIIDVLIFLIIAALLLVVVARLHQPLNLITAGVITLAVFLVAHKLFGLAAFTVLLTLWMIIVIAGLYVLRVYFHQQHTERHQHVK